MFKNLNCLFGHKWTKWITVDNEKGKILLNHGIINGISLYKQRKICLKCNKIKEIDL